jgi:hypothetical protein
MTDKDINAILKVLSNLSDEIIETQKRQLKMIDVIGSIRGALDQTGKALTSHKEYMEKLFQMTHRIASGSSDPTLADDLNRIATGVANPVKPAEEEVPPKELLN